MQYFTSKHNKGPSYKAVCLDHIRFGMFCEVTICVRCKVVACRADRPSMSCCGEVKCLGTGKWIPSIFGTIPDATLFPKRRASLLGYWLVEVDRSLQSAYPANYCEDFIA